MPDAVEKTEERHARECRKRIYRDERSERSHAFERGVVFGLHEATVMIEDYLRDNAQRMNDADFRVLPPGHVLGIAADEIARGDWLLKDPEPILFTSDHDVETDDD